MNDRTFSHLHAHKLDLPERKLWLPVQDVLKELKLQPGATVADIGVGTGYFALPIAGAVGEHGTVFAVDLQTEMLSSLKAKLTEAGISNIQCITGEASATGLESGSCEFVLMANLWHELDHIPRVLRETKRLLRSNGRLGILDWRPGVEQPPGPPLEHRIPSMRVVEDLAISGFKLITNQEIGLYSYLVIASVDTASGRS